MLATGISIIVIASMRQHTWQSLRTVIYEIASLVSTSRNDKKEKENARLGALFFVWYAANPCLPVSSPTKYFRR